MGEGSTPDDPGPGDYTGQSSRNSFMVVSVSSLIVSLIIETGNSNNAGLGIPLLVAVTNAIAVVPPGVLLAVTSIRRKDGFRESGVLMMLSSAMTLNIYSTLHFLAIMLGFNLLIIFSIAFLSVFVLTMAGFIIVLRPGVRRGRVHDRKLSDTYTRELTAETGKEFTIILSSRWTYGAPAVSYSEGTRVVVSTSREVLDALDESETAALLLHEAGHHLHRYSRSLFLCIFFLVYAAYFTVFIYFGSAHFQSYIQIPVLLGALASMPIAFREAAAMVRRGEYAADSYCVGRMGDRRPLLNLLEKLDSMTGSSSLTPESRKRVSSEIRDRISRLIPETDDSKPNI